MMSVLLTIVVYMTEFKAQHSTHAWCR